MYALRDLMGHCYMHFAFVFTLRWLDWVQTAELRNSETVAQSNSAIVHNIQTEYQGRVCIAYIMTGTYIRVVTNVWHSNAHSNAYSYAYTSFECAFAFAFECECKTFAFAFEC